MQDQSKTMAIKKSIVRSNQRDGTIIEVIGATRCWIASADARPSVTRTNRPVFISRSISFFLFSFIFIFHFFEYTSATLSRGSSRRYRESRLCIDSWASRFDRGTNDNPRCLVWFIDNKKCGSVRRDNVKAFGNDRSRRLKIAIRILFEVCFKIQTTRWKLMIKHVWKCIKLALEI